MKKELISKLIAVILMGTIGATVFTKEVKTNAQELVQHSFTTESKDNLIEQIKEDKLRAQFEEDKIPVDVQERLIEKKRNGEMWDCENEEKLNAIPDDYFTFTFNEIADKTYNFTDGSYVRMTGTVINDINSPKSRTKRSAYERNIPRLHVEASYGGTRLGIYANVSMYYGGSATINSVEPTGVVYAFNGRLAADPSPYIAKKDGTTSSPALAVYAPKFTRDAAIGSGKTFTAEYNLYVTGVGYSATVNQY